MALIIYRTLASIPKLLQNENPIVFKDFDETYNLNSVKVLIVNLMPNKVDTEIQFLNIFANIKLNVDVTFLYLLSHKNKNTCSDYLKNNYKTFDEIRHHSYDGMIITGAPLEKLDFEEVDYWEELKSIFDFSVSKIKSTVYVCWSSMAALYYYYGIPKILTEKKIFGVFTHSCQAKDNKLLTDFKLNFPVPHSRYFDISKDYVRKIDELEILISSKDGSIHAIASKDYKKIFLSGHWEYENTTLKKEYLRDLDKGLTPPFPLNYFSFNDVNTTPINTWNNHGVLFFKNWLNIISNKF